MSSTGLMPAQHELQAFGSTTAELSAGPAQQVRGLMQCCAWRLCAWRPGILEDAIYTLRGVSTPGQGTGLVQPLSGPALQ